MSGAFGYGKPSSPNSPGNQNQGAFGYDKNKSAFGNKNDRGAFGHQKGQAFNSVFNEGRYRPAYDSKESWLRIAPQKQGQQREEPERNYKYPILSDIQEIIDRLQALWASGTSFADQKTIDMTESEYRMLPFVLGGAVFRLGLFFILALLGTFIVNLFLATISYKLVNILPIALFVVSGLIFFAAYVIYSGQQFVVPGEKERKTQQYYGILLALWRANEIFMFSSIFILILLKIFERFWAGLTQSFLMFLNNKFGWALSVVSFQNALKYTIITALLFAVGYVIFVVLVRRRFKRIQLRNLLALYRQFDPEKAVEKRLNGEF